METKTTHGSTRQHVGRQSTQAGTGRQDKGPVSIQPLTRNMWKDSVGVLNVD